MKKLLWSFLLVSLLSTAQAWVIEDFDVVADIQTDGSIIITEKITGDFSDNLSKRGIFRDIPFAYTQIETGKLYKTPLVLLGITDENGAGRMFTEVSNNTHKSFKIGNPNVNVSPTEVYKIQYKVTRVLQSFEGHDEFYWNVSGDDWDAAKKRIRMKVNLPVESQMIKTECYTGVSGSTEADCKHVSVGKNGAAYMTNDALAPNEDLTVVFGFDKGLVEIPERVYTVDFMVLLVRYWDYILYLLYASFLWPFYEIVKAIKRRLAQPKLPVIPLYEKPEGISLLEMGYLQDFKIDVRDLSALLISLCVDGAMKIEVIENKKSSLEYKFTKLDDTKVSTDDQRYVFDNLFPKDKEEHLLSVNSVKTDKSSIFHPYGFNAFKRLVQNSLPKEKYLFYKVKPFSKSNFFKINFISFFIIPMYFLIGFQIFLTLKLIASASWELVVFMSLVLFVFLRPTILANIAPFTPVAHRLKNKIAGYAEFLETAEKEQINWSEAQNIFEKNLPGAIALGMTDKWVERFGDAIVMPDWYQADQPISQIVDFDKKITGHNTKIQRKLSREARSSSSGFSSGGGGGGRSGGGSGGGGGRSW